MPYIKPKPQQLEPTATASAYNNHKPLPKEDMLIESPNGKTNLGPISSGKGEYLNGSQEYTEYTLMSSEKFRYYPKTGKVYPVKGSYSSWCPEQKQINYDDIAKKREYAKQKQKEEEKEKKIEYDKLNKKIEINKVVEQKSIFEVE